jgi:hypothetical protein
MKNEKINFFIIIIMKLTTTNKSSKYDQLKNIKNYFEKKILIFFRIMSIVSNDNM